MAKTDEEEYLDSLLKSMSMDESDNTTKKVNDTDIKNSSEELDNFDTLSLDENNNNKEKSKETGSTEDNKPEQEDLDSRVLNEMLLNDSKSIPDEAYTEDDNIDKADDNVNETGKDFSKDNTDETSVEDMLKTVQNNSYEQNNDELGDILALDDGMTVDDVPDDISEESALTDEENRKVQDISSNSTVETDKPVVKKEKKKKVRKKDYNYEEIYQLRINCSYGSNNSCRLWKQRSKSRWRKFRCSNHCNVKRRRFRNKRSFHRTVWYRRRRKRRKSR